MPAYKEKFVSGTQVRILNRNVLEEFKRTWKYHSLEAAQLDCAGQKKECGELVSTTAAILSTLCKIFRAFGTKVASKRKMKEIR